MNSLLTEGGSVSRKKIYPASSVCYGSVYSKSNSGIGIKFLRLGFPDIFSDIGYPEELYERYRINKDGIKGGVKEVIAKT